MSQMAQLIAEVQENNETIEELTNKVDELTAEVEDIGDVIDAGKCGDNIYYVLYSNGKLLLKGTGDMYDYDNPLNPTGNDSPFFNNQNIKNAVVSEGITDIGEYAFRYCDELETVSLPGTLTKISNFAFYPHQDSAATPTVTHELKAVTIPSSVTEIGYCAFAGNRLTTVTVPSTVTTIGERVFTACANLTTVRYEAPVINEFMFVNCNRLVNLTLARTVTEIKSHCFNYCHDLISRALRILVRCGSFRKIMPDFLRQKLRGISMNRSRITVLFLCLSAGSVLWATMSMYCMSAAVSVPESITLHGKRSPTIPVR